jgi:hypothetical protein
MTHEPTLAIPFNIQQTLGFVVKKSLTSFGEKKFPVKKYFPSRDRSSSIFCRLLLHFSGILCIQKGKEILARESGLKQNLPLGFFQSEEGRLNP